MAELVDAMGLSPIVLTDVQVRVLLDAPLKIYARDSSIKTHDIGS
jgi:hypothetical protein